MEVAQIDLLLLYICTIIVMFMYKGLWLQKAMRRRTNISKVVIQQRKSITQIVIHTFIPAKLKINEDKILEK